MAVGDGWNGKVTISGPPATDAVISATEDLIDSGLVAGTPIEITASDSLPEGGVVISRSYPQPLPEDVAATLAYFDTKSGSWEGVASTLSEDRRTVSARVSHLSVWDDFLAGSRDAVDDARRRAGDTARAANQFRKDATAWGQKALSDVADNVYYGVGKVFDVRVDQPLCEGAAPAWVQSAVMIEDHRNNPVRFCVGHDAKNPDLLVIKARSNRGYAFAAHLGARTVWRYNSSDPQDLWGALTPWLKSHDEAFRDSLLKMTGPNPGLVVDAGQELSVGMAEDDVRAMKGDVALRLDPPSSQLFVASVLGQLLDIKASRAAEGRVALMLAVSQCASSVQDGLSGDAGKATRAVIACLQSSWDSVIKGVVNQMLKAMPDDAAAAKAFSANVVEVAKRLDRVSVYASLIGPVVSAANRSQESGLSADARTVHIFTAPKQVRPQTKIRYVSILDSNGALKPEYAVDDYTVAGNEFPASCTDEASISTTPDVLSCTPTALPAACWRNPDGSATVLCLENPWERSVGMSDAPLEPVQSRDHSQPDPYALQLTDGTRWQVRRGGAWPFLGKGTYGAYFQVGGKDSGFRALVSTDDGTFTKENGTWSILRAKEVASDEVPRDAERVDIAEVWYAGDPP